MNKSRDESKGSIDLSNRDFLYEIEQEALFRANQNQISELWASVYRRLAEVVCELDGYIARSEKNTLRPTGSKKDTVVQDLIVNPRPNPDSPVESVFMA